ncbi:uncharacterized protein LOC119768596 [Culex quinquefasciatus]|uniref:uncharacterized protein LOC119768596 n=1 Tax=Culex quinquefasciatus TaxID=7176 RepID=UPI0018E318E4|nr:uncharacterized protein LOC119768596 [Culex quinquefasciatus]
MFGTRKNLGMRNGLGAAMLLTNPEWLLLHVCWSILCIVESYRLFLHDDYSAFIRWIIVTALLVLIFPSKPPALRSYGRPPFSSPRFTLSNMVGFLLAKTVLLAIPSTEWIFLHWLLAPFGVAIGIWSVGNLGIEKGVIWHSLAAAFLSYANLFVLKFVPNNTHRLAVVTFVTAIAFNLFSKEWDIPNHVQSPRRVANQIFNGAVQFFSIVILPLFEFYQNVDKIDSDAEDRWNVFYGYAKIWWKVLCRLYKFIQQNDQAA